MAKKKQSNSLLLKCTSNFHDKTERVRPYRARLFPPDMPEEGKNTFKVEVSSDEPIALIPGRTYEVSIKEK